MVLKLCMDYIVWTMFETIMVLLVNVFCEICIACEICICDCGLCVFCCELKGAEKSVLGGIMNFRRPVRRPTKTHAGRQLFSWATRADENKAPIFVGHQGRHKYPFERLIFVGLEEADEHRSFFIGLGEADENRSFSSVPTK
jgi:hypothetical protein